RRPDAGEAVLVGIAGAGIARQQIADGALAGGPALLEVLEELVPAPQVVAVHVALGKREGVIEPDDRRLLLRDLAQEPLRQVPPAPPSGRMALAALLKRLVVLHRGVDLDLANG